MSTGGARLWRDVVLLGRGRSLLAVLTRREIGARFAGSAGGVLWAWVQPALSIAAYFLVFDVVFALRMGEGAPTARVGTFLIVGMLAWMAFSDATQRAMGSLVEVGGLLQKNALPPALFPARAVLARGRSGRGGWRSPRWRRCRPRIATGACLGCAARPAPRSGSAHASWSSWPQAR